MRKLLRRRYSLRQISPYFTLAVMLGSLITGNVFYAFFSADIKINEEKIKLLEKREAERQATLDMVLTNEQITQRYMAELKQLFINRKDEESKKLMESLLEEMQKNKIKTIKENNKK